MQCYEQRSKFYVIIVIKHTSNREMQHMKFTFVFYDPKINLHSRFAHEMNLKPHFTCALSTYFGSESREGSEC